LSDGGFAAGPRPVLQSLAPACQDGQVRRIRSSLVDGERGDRRIPLPLSELASGRHGKRHLADAPQARNQAQQRVRSIAVSREARHSRRISLRVQTKCARIPPILAPRPTPWMRLARESLARSVGGHLNKPVPALPAPARIPSTSKIVPPRPGALDSSADDVAAGRRRDQVAITPTSGGAETTAAGYRLGAINRADQRLVDRIGDSFRGKAGLGRRAAVSMPIEGRESARSRRRL